MSKDKLNDIDDNFVKSRATKITDDDVKKAYNNSDNILKKAKEPLSKLFESIKLLLSLVKDYHEGNYREIPWWAIAAIVFALLYVLSPVDLIPDFVPVIGYLDDAAVVGVCLKLVDIELQKYKEWKQSSSNF